MTTDIPSLQKPSHTSPSFTFYGLQNFCVPFLIHCKERNSTNRHKLIKNTGFVPATVKVRGDGGGQLRSIGYFERFIKLALVIKSSQHPYPLKKNGHDGVPNPFLKVGTKDSKIDMPRCTLQTKNTKLMFVRN